MPSPFIHFPVELAVAGVNPEYSAEAKDTATEAGERYEIPQTIQTFKIVTLRVRPSGVLATSPAQDAPLGSVGKTVIYFNQTSGMKPVTTPLSDDEVEQLVADAENL